MLITALTLLQLIAVSSSFQLQIPSFRIRAPTTDEGPVLRLSFTKNHYKFHNHAYRVKSGGYGNSEMLRKRQTLVSSSLHMTKPLQQESLDATTTDSSDEKNTSTKKSLRKRGRKEKSKSQPGSKRNNEWNTSIFPKPLKKKKSTKPPTPIPNIANPGSITASSSTPIMPPVTSKIMPIAFPYDSDLDESNELLPQTYVQLLAIGIGIVTGVSVAGFKLSINAIRQFCYGDGFHSIWVSVIQIFGGANAAASTSGEEVLIPFWIIPILGGLMVSILNLGGFSPGLRGAVNEVDDDSLSYPTDVDKSGGDSGGSFGIMGGEFNLDFRPVRKAMAATFTLGTGNSLGPEGPGVEIGVAVSRFWMMLWPPDLTASALSSGKEDSSSTMKTEADPGESMSSVPTATEGTSPNSDAMIYNKVVERVSRNRLLLACGAAAGVSSGFNAPLSGVFFALEVVQAALPSPLSLPSISNLGNSSPNGLLANAGKSNDDSSVITPSMNTDQEPGINVEVEPPPMQLQLQQQSLSGNPGSITAILISSVVSTLVSRIFLGDELALQVLTYDISTPLSELPLYSILGVCCGIVSVAFSQTAKFSKAILEGEAGPAFVRDTFSRVPSFTLPLIGGMTCGVVGYVYPQILFFGYETLNGLLENENLATELLLVLLLAKIFTTAVSAGSGLVGGTLAPSLFMGGELDRNMHCILLFEW